MNKQLLIFIYSLTLSLFLPVTVAFANPTLPKVRVFYRPDGGVSILHFVMEACRQGETKIQCMDRISEDSAYKNLPYDDMQLNQLPKDRADRDKWRGEKGKGIRIDRSLVTKNEKINQLNSELDKELEKNEPNSSRVLKLQHLVEKAKDIDHNILTDDDLTIFENKRKSILATVANVVGDLMGGVFSTIKNEFLALKSLLVEKIQIGTVEKPAGITTYDLETRQPYCQVVRGGKLELIPGECPTEFTPQAGPQIENTPDQNTISASGGSDTEAPVITVQGPSLIEFEKGTNWVDPGATVTDNINPNIGLYYKLDGVRTGNDGRDLPTIDTNIVGEYTISYSAADEAGNISVATRTVKVVDSTVEANIETVVGTSETTVVSEQPTGAVSEAGVVSDQPSAAE